MKRNNMTNVTVWTEMRTTQLSERCKNGIPTNILFSFNALIFKTVANHQRIMKQWIKSMSGFTEIIIFICIVHKVQIINVASVTECDPKVLKPVDIKFDTLVTLD